MSAFDPEQTSAAQKLLLQQLDPCPYFTSRKSLL
jgi:hypothetical protein